jgi:BNR repeat-like domain
MNDARIHRRGFFATAISAATVAVEFQSGRRAIAAGIPKLKIGPVRRVGPEGVKHIQPSLAANPRDRSNLVVVASRFLGKSQARAGVHQEPVAYFTTDGGVSWAAGEFDGDAVMRRATSMFGDAWAVYAPDGTAFCAFDGSPTGDRLDLWVRRSDDGGRRWHEPTVVSNGRILDYCKLVADLVGDKPRLFVAVATRGDRPLFAKSRRSGYGCAILRSDDGARSFSAVNFLAPTTLHHDPIESPLFLPDGRLLVGFADYPADPSDKEPRGHLAHGRIYAATSGDGGATFSTPTPICENVFHDGFVQIAVDRSGGPYRGRVYAVAHSRSSNPPGLQLQSSGDGAVWTPPVDVPGLRAGPIPLAGAAVSSQGVLGLAWVQGDRGDAIRFDDEAWTSREHAWDLYVTASSDGGATFTTPVAVLGTPSRTDAKLWRWPFGTEYITLAASPDGSFHLLWVNTRDSRGEIHTARIVVES